MNFWKPLEIGKIRILPASDEDRKKATMPKVHYLDNDDLKIMALNSLSYHFETKDFRKSILTTHLEPLSDEFLDLIDNKKLQEFINVKEDME